MPAAPLKRGTAQLTFNVDTVNVRTETLEGVEYWAAPAVMILEGVHEGSNGKIFYPVNEIARSDPGWNNKPITVYHPTLDGQPWTAADPNVLETQRIGFLLNTRTDSTTTKQHTECWFNKEKTKKVDSRVSNALEKKQTLEVSTGVHLEIEESPGTWRTEEYDGIARNQQADHLAVLPDKIGACSRQKGAGILMNSDPELYFNRSFSSDQRKKMASAGTAMSDGSYPIGNIQDLKNAIQAFGRAKNKAATKRHIIKRARAMGRMDLIPDNWGGTSNELEVLANELSFNDITSQLRQLLAAKFGDPGQYWSGCICDVFEDRVIFSEDYGSDSMQAIGYTVTNDSVSLYGDAVPVERVVQYQTANSETVPGYSEVRYISNLERTHMSNKVKVDALIANGRFKEEKRAWLMGLAEADLDGIITAVSPPVPTNNQTPTLVTNNAPAPVPGAPNLTEELAKMHPSIRAFVQNGLAALEGQRAELIANIKANPNNAFPDEWLATAEIPVLQRIAKMAGPTAAQQVQNTLGLPFLPPTSFVGAGGAIPVQNVSEEAYVAPALDYATKPQK